MVPGRRSFRRSVVLATLARSRRYYQQLDAYRIYFCISGRLWGRREIGLGARDSVGGGSVVCDASRVAAIFPLVAAARSGKLYQADVWIGGMCVIYQLKLVGIFVRTSPCAVSQDSRRRKIYLRLAHEQPH